jgi:hypothetical protein
MQHGAIVIPFLELRARAAERPAGYFEDVVASGTVVGESVHLSLAAHRRLVAKYQGAKPAEEWPLWALLAGLWFRQPEDAGVGDTIAMELGGASSEAFKRHHEAVFGIWAKPCGCAGQVASWNALYRYGGGE